MSIIKKAQTIPLNGRQMRKLCPDSTIVMYDEFQKINNIDDVLYPSGSAIILIFTDMDSGHWVGLMTRDSNILSFFCPYGLTPDSAQNYKFVDTDVLIRRNETYNHLSKLLIDSRYELINYNPYRLQGSHKIINSKSLPVSTCGRHVAVRIWLKELNDEEYCKFIYSSRHNPDTLVTILTENVLKDFPWSIYEIADTF